MALFTNDMYKFRLPSLGYHPPLAIDIMHLGLKSWDPSAIMSHEQRVVRN